MTRSPGAFDTDPIAAELVWAERRIALLDACVPRNAAAERERVVAAWEAGRPSLPRWVLPVRNGLGEVRRRLADVARQSLREHPHGALFAERAAELELEGALVEARGSPELPRLCRLRYPVTEREAAWAAELGAAWLDSISRAPPEEEVERVTPEALVVALRERIAATGLAARVELRGDLTAPVAVGEDVVFVAENGALRRDQIERMVLHEIEGHLVPRLAARREASGLFRVGSAGAGEDEEGRALLLEERAGHWATGTERGDVRRWELALRHRAAVAARAGADFVEIMRLLIDLGEGPRRAYRISERVLRGGGLAREIAYLPALKRVRAAFEERPELEGWMRRGRISVAAARWLDGCVGPPARTDEERVQTPGEAEGPRSSTTGT